MTDLPKPSEKPRWATDISAAITTPPNEKQDIGWIVEYPPHQFFNWLARKTYDWINYFEAKTDTGLGGSPETTLTIASGSVTPTSSGHAIDTEGGAATDDLTNLLTTNLSDGNLLLIHTVSAARIVTIKHNAGGAGQISLSLGVDLVLESPTEWVFLKRNGANWVQVLSSQVGSDATPFLGGDLDVRTKKIWSSITNGDVVIEPNGTGAVVPLTSAKALGSTSKRWNIFGTALDLSGNIAAASIALSGHMYANQVDATALAGILNIGDTNASLINIGRTGATIALYGSVTEVHTTNAYVTDKLITLNDGGLASTGSGVGIEVEENALITGYVKTSSNRNKWSFLSPNSAEIISLGTEAAVVGDIGIVSNQLHTMFSGYNLKNSSGDTILSSSDDGTHRIGISGGNEKHFLHGTLICDLYGDSGGGLISANGTCNIGSNLYYSFGYKALTTGKTTLFITHNGTYAFSWNIDNSTRTIDTTSILTQVGNISMEGGWIVGSFVGTNGGVTPTSSASNSLSIRGLASSITSAAILQLGDTTSASSREFAFVNGHNGTTANRGNLYLLAGTAIDTFPTKVIASANALGSFVFGADGAANDQFFKGKSIYCYAEGTSATDRNFEINLFHRNTSDLTGTNFVLKVQKAKCIISATYANSDSPELEFQQSGIDVGGYDTTGTWNLGINSDNTYTTKINSAYLGLRYDATTKNRYLMVVDSTNLDSMITIQPAGGSATFGGGLILYGKNAAGNSGGIDFGLAQGVTGAKFSFRDSGVGGGSEISSCSYAGNWIFGISTNLHEFKTQTATSATAGTRTLPANPLNFWTVKINGTTVQIPYYSV